MLAERLAFNPRSKGTNIGYLLFWGADSVWILLVFIWEVKRESSVIQLQSTLLEAACYVILIWAKFFVNCNADFTESIFKCILVPCVYIFCYTYRKFVVAISLRTIFCVQ